MISRKWILILLLYVVTPVLCMLVRYPWKEEEKVRTAYAFIANDEELYVLDILTFGSVSTLLGGVFLSLPSVTCRNDFTSSST